MLPRSSPRSAPVVLVLLLPACGAVPLVPDDQRDDSASFPVAVEAPPLPRPPIPVDAEVAWLRFESGECLQGELTRIRDGEVVFDSEQLDDQTFDLDDVEELRTFRSQVVVTDAGAVLRGRVVLSGDDLWVEGERTVHIARSQVFAMLPVSGGRVVDWSGDVSLGASIRKGNTDQVDYDAHAELTRESARTLWETSYQGTFNTTDDVRTANSHRLASTYSVFLSRRLYLFLPTVDLFRDPFQNIDLRATVAAGVGYELVDTADHDWRVGLGPAVQYLRDIQPQAGAPRDETNEAVFGRTKYVWNLTDDADLDFEYTITAALPDTEEYDSHFAARLSVELLGDLTLEVAFLWDRVNRPAPDSSGQVPLADDYRTTVGLGWSF